MAQFSYTCTLVPAPLIQAFVIPCRQARWHRRRLGLVGQLLDMTMSGERPLASRKAVPTMDIAPTNFLGGDMTG